MLRILFASALILTSAAGYAQFNKCGYGFCPNGLTVDGFRVPGSSIPPPTCNPGSATGEMDFSVCSNVAITAALW